MTFRADSFNNDPNTIVLGVHTSLDQSNDVKGNYFWVKALLDCYQYSSFKMVPGMPCHGRPHYMAYMG